MLDRIAFGFQKYRFEILYRPGAWMAERELAGLHARLLGIASAKLSKAPEFSFFGDKSLLKNKLVSICSDAGTDISFCVMTHLGTYRGRNVLHLGAVYSLREDSGFMQLVYIFGLLYYFIRNWFFRRVYITSITHTPKIFGVVCDSFDCVFPNLDPQMMPGEFHRALKNMFSETYLREWTLPVTPVITDCFTIPGFRRQMDGSILYPDTEITVPKHRRPEYNSRCIGLIDYTTGDVVLQVGRSSGLALLLKNSKIFNKARK